VDTATSKMIRMYLQQAQTQLFLSSKFQAPPENFYKSEYVGIDIERSDEDIAIAIQDMSAGYRDNSGDIYTNKRFKAPVFKEKLALNAFDLMNRVPGKHTYEDPEFQATAIAQSYKGFRKIENKIRRAIELQASQILQTGTVSLTNAAGDVLYTIDYKPKATHFPTAGTAWNAVGATITDDILALAEVNRDDGLMDSDEILMGQGSYEVAIQDTTFLARFDNRRVSNGSLTEFTPRNDGSYYRGRITIGNYGFDVFTYNGRYKDPATGAKIKYLADDKVVVRSSMGRLDATFGAIPKFAPMDAAVLPFLPGRVSGSNIDLHMNAWFSDDREQFFAGLGARPLLIPTAIDTYGCLDTGI